MRTDGASPRFIASCVTAAGLITTVSVAVAQPTLGFREDFRDGTFAGWTGGAARSNPGTGGASGVGDGYLYVYRTVSGHLGANTGGVNEYVGDWTTSGITQIRLWLNDSNTDEALEIHLSIGNGGNLWQYNVGFLPPHREWAPFVVDLTDSNSFTQIISTGGFYYQLALQTADRLLIRHDLAPYFQTPDQIVGNFGLDRILFTNGIVGVDGLGPSTARPVELAPVFPNPASGPVTLAFRSFTSDPLRVEIVDVLGRRVRTAELPGLVGLRSWSWDGCDDRGARTAPGAYRARVTGPAGGTSQPIVRVD